MTKMMGISDGNELFEDIVLEAYDKPRYNTQSMKDWSIKDNGNDIYLSCVKTYKDKK